MTDVATLGAQRTPPKRGRVFYLDLLRAVAILAVITIHVAGQNWSKVDVSAFAWGAFNFYDAVTRWAVPVFVMISGALFLDPEREVSSQKIYRKSIPRLVIAFGFWSTFYALATRVDDPQSILSLDTFKSLVLGHFHLWFIYMIVGLYAIVPILRKITEDDAVTRLFLGIAIVLAFAAPTLLKVVEQMQAIYDGTFLRMVSVVLSAYKKVHFTFGAGYVTYFVLGCYLHRVTLSRRQRWGIYLVGLLGFVVTVAFTALFSRYAGKPYKGLYDNLTLNVLVEAVGVFVLAKQVAAGVDGRGMRQLVEWMSSTSFGAYLVHPFLIDCLDAFLGINTLTLLTPVVAVLAIVIAVYLMSSCAAAVLRKLPRIGTAIT